MFVIPIKKDNSTSISAASLATYTYTDPIPLTAKWFDNKSFALKVDIGSLPNTSASSDSGQLSIYPAISEKSGGTYVTFTCDSGTSLVITSGTSATGYMSNGSYFIPLVQVIASGVTRALRTMPYIKFGYRSHNAAKPWAGYLCAG